MKWRELFSKKKEQEKSPEAAPQPKPEPPLVFGTLDFFPLESCEDDTAILGLKSELQ